MQENDLVYRGEEGCAQGEGKVRTTPIGQALDRQSSLTREIGEMLTSLGDKLQPVRGEEVPRDCCEESDEKRDMDKVVNKIQHNNYLLTNCLHTIMAYTSELDL